MNKSNENILNHIYSSVSMGAQSLTKLSEFTDDCSMDNCMAEQVTQLRDFKNQAQELLAQEGIDVKHPSKMASIMNELMIDVKAMNCNSRSKVAETMMRGAGMGIISTSKLVNENKDASQEVIDLANRMIDFSLGQFNNMREYL